MNKDKWIRQISRYLLVFLVLLPIAQALGMGQFDARETQRQQEHERPQERLEYLHDMMPDRGEDDFERLQTDEKPCFTGIKLTGIDDVAQNKIAQVSGKARIEKDKLKGETRMKISVTSNGKTTIFELNESNAAKKLYAQLPLTIAVENYGSNEKIFYLPKKLNTADTPLVSGAKAGTLAYYAPWGNIVMFYDTYGSASGLYELGNAISGEEHIKGMSGAIQVNKAD